MNTKTLLFTIKMDLLTTICNQKDVQIVHNSDMKTIEAYRSNVMVGILEYCITTDNYTIHVLRSRLIQKETLCMNVKNINVNEKEQGKRIGSLLFSHTIFIALQNKCECIILDDMSDNARSMHHNLYSKFGAVFKDITLHPSDDTVINSGPEKQLKLLPESIYIQLIRKLFQ